MTRASQRGFSLLEVLVAFAILGISLGILLQIFAGGARNTAIAEEYARATLYAESILAAIGREAPLTAGANQGGIDDTFVWRSEVTPYLDENLNPETLNVAPYRVVVEVSWRTSPQTARAVTLQTLRLTTPVEP